MQKVVDCKTSLQVTLPVTLDFSGASSAMATVLQHVPGKIIQLVAFTDLIK